MEIEIPLEDAIPNSINLFKEKTALSLFDYHCIGFSLEHTLIKYNIIEVHNLLIMCHLNALVDDY